MRSCAVAGFVAAALVALAVVSAAAEEPRRVAPADENIVAGPEASPELIAAITERDRQLFAAVFDACDADALAAMLADDFEFVHDKGGVIDSKDVFVANVRQGCEAEARGENVQASRELVPGTLRIYAVSDDGAIEYAVHNFYGHEPGREPVLRETGQLFQFWRRIDGEWMLSRVFSYDHRPAAR
jgi:hypothetical protein